MEAASTLCPIRDVGGSDWLNRFVDRWIILERRISCCCGFFERDVHLTVGAGHLGANGMRWKFDVSFAKVARYFETFLRFAQRKSGLALWARNGLPQILQSEFYMSAAGWAGHL